MKIYCLADEDTVRGFRLAGISGQVVATAEQAETAINQLVSQPEIGLLIITEQLAGNIRGLINTIRLNADRPLIVEIPGPDGPLNDRKTLSQIAKEAVGVNMEAEDVA
ncbi:MAG: V-type ATP synthase subunit F [Victivallales bacterium]|jgi:V/A-type H+-transporting ATPase subunit F